MNKTAIKNFAIWARKQLIGAVSQKAFEYEITEGGVNDPGLEAVAGRPLSQTEKHQRAQLIAEIRSRGYDAVMEEAAYTWFNRFIALRFMEVNGYLPSKVRIFTDENGEFKPEIIKQALEIDLEGLDRERVLSYLDVQDNEGLYRYLLITQCNALNEALPYMFEKISNWTELLFPANLLRPDSIIARMISDIPEEDWTDQVEIIGWLYQFYNTEQNELVYDGSMSKSRISKDLLPAATTMYTPDWAVHYMVENSLGKMWLEGHPDSDIKQTWKFFLEEEKQALETTEQLSILRKKFATINPEEIKVMDPCMGSGHILVVLFDVLMQIYSSYGYSERDAAVEIIENNLYGLDIDKRAFQLSCFAVMMKARQYNRRILAKGLKPNLFVFTEVTNLTPDYVKMFGTQELNAKKLLKNFENAREYGSIIQILLSADELAELRQKLEEIKTTAYENFVDIDMRNRLLAEFEPLLELAETVSQKYDVVITNPPYLGNPRFSPLLDEYVKANFAEVKSDLSMVMFKQSLDKFVKDDGFISFITTSSWMFLSSFEKIRDILFSQGTISSLVDFGTELFDGKVGHNPIVSWVTRKSKIINYQFTAIRLVDYCYSRRDEKIPEFYKSRNRYSANQENFSKIPGSPIAYWIGKSLINVFEIGIPVSSYVHSFQGIITGDNNRFLREWYELCIHKIALNYRLMNDIDLSKKYWIPYNKGGDFRKWYGNQDYVVNWKNGPDDKVRGRKTNQDFYLHEYVSWSYITSSSIAVRFFPQGFLWDVAGSGYFDKNGYSEYIQALISSNVGKILLDLLNPTINFQVENILSIPVIDSNHKDEIDEIVHDNIHISKTDWDSFETSWNFKRHPLI